MRMLGHLFRHIPLAATTLFAGLIPGCAPALDGPASPSAPVLRAVSPARAPTSGGVELTLAGEHFAPGATVTIDGIASSYVRVNSGTSITAVLPARAGAWGPVSVVVTNPDGHMGARDDLFAYHASQLSFAGSVYATGQGPMSVVAYDFNGDHALDLAVASAGTNSVDVFLGNGQGGFSAASEFPIGQSPWNVVVGDVRSKLVNRRVAHIEGWGWSCGGRTKEPRSRRGGAASASAVMSQRGRSCNPPPSGKARVTRTSAPAVGRRSKTT